jgi:hypothetical protein
MDVIRILIPTLSFFHILVTVYPCLGNAVICWLRHYATSGKVAGSSRDEMDYFQFT